MTLSYMATIDKIVAAFEQQDYRTANQLVQALLNKSPQDPWGRFYLARLYEENGKPDAAETLYRKLLKETAIPKVALQARQGLKRLEEAEEQRRRQAIADATIDPGSHELGFLILEPILGESRVAAASHFARIMKIDPHTARLTLPSQGWQLYRTGSIGELKFYQQELQKHNLPAFCFSLAEIQALPVLRVDYLDTITPTAKIICRSPDNQLGSFEFDWSEVTQRVDGLVPIFEEVLDIDVRGRLEKKQRTQDYVQFCDLHLRDRPHILRFCDQTYQFQEGAEIPTSEDSQPLNQSTARLNWNALLRFFKQQVPTAPTWSTFKAFGETTIDHRLSLGKIKSHIDLARKIETHWDSAFHLYSSLIFLKNWGM